MILYVNGDSHAAAAEAVNPHAWAFDDGDYWNRGKEPHPDNDAVSFGRQLANTLGWQYFNHSQAGGSNARIIRTTQEWLDQQPTVQDVFVLIQWSTWEREEWFWQGDWLQVNASGADHVPPELETKYKQYIIDIDWRQVQQQAHDQIWQFHQDLTARGVRHFFFNGNNHFDRIPDQPNWQNCYLDPYNAQMTYDSVLRQHGFQTVNAQSWHFGPDAHCFWANYLLKYTQLYQQLQPNEIPTDRHS